LFTSLSKSSVLEIDDRGQNAWGAKKPMSINQDSTTHNNGPAQALSMSRSGLLSVDNSTQLVNPRFGAAKPEQHSLMAATPGMGGQDPFRSFQQIPSGPTIKREVKFRWDNQQDCVTVDRKNDYKATFFLTNLSTFPWKPGMAFILQLGDEKREQILNSEVQMQNDTKCEFDLRDLAEKKPKDLKVELCIAGSSLDPVTKEKTKYFSERIPIGKLEFK
jgi:hypothetical protein